MPTVMYLEAARFTMNKICFAYAMTLLCIAVTNDAEAAKWQNVPVKYECNRIYAELQVNGKPQYFFTDSGGGLKPFTFKETTDAWKISAPKYVEAEEEGAKFVIANIDWPANIGWSFYPKKSETVSLRIADCSKHKKNEFCLMKEFMKDGFVGAGWYADRVWQLDYFKGTAAYADTLPEKPKAKPLKIGFKTESGKRTSQQPRMAVEIDGKSHDMLLDTGATGWHSEDAMKLAGAGSPFCATSFIRQSVFDELKKNHPEWKVVTRGDRFSGGMDMLEVPSIKVGDHSVGPVLFAARKDKIYDYYSKEFMDKNIDGAIGGNIFKHFKVTIDYPKSQLFFEKP